ncbi:MAG: alginate lyase family protein, partial [Planctomycetota bacterium]|nr:alginate lyase family protein [Planctomycetota bacterium]
TVADLDTMPGPRRTPDLRARLQTLERGRCYYFCDYESPDQISWYKNPFDGTRSQPGPIWCDIPDYLPSQGDPRWLWEPARAGWAFETARAAARDERTLARSVFWQWCRSWMDECAPFEGFHWKCGQESAVRFIALAVGFWANSATGAEPQDWRDFIRLAWATGFRIQHHIDYAISQKNNHAISEAAGLLVISHLFPELRQSDRWRLLGRKVLIQELRRQVYDDGSYVQHSLNYQRVMLHGAILSARILELQGDPLPPDVYHRLGKSVEFLYQMLDNKSGEGPQYGNNDGAYVLPLTDCPFWDFRPVVQAGYFLVHRRRLLTAGPWDEESRWLFGNEFINPCPAASPPAESVGSSAVTVPQQRSSTFKSGGYYTLRAEASWCMLRCHTFNDRPAHYDQLHLDLWSHGVNLIRDCGTHRYYMPDRPDLETHFKSIRAHNTIELNGHGPLQSVSRFLWLPWPRGKLTSYVATGDVPHLEATHFDYEKRPWRTTHRRLVASLPENIWLIVDDLRHRSQTRDRRNDVPIRVTQRWHLANLDWQVESAGVVRAETSSGPAWLCVNCGTDDGLAEHANVQQQEIVKGRDLRGSIEGFASRSYGQREAIPVYVSTFGLRKVRRVVTAIAIGSRIQLQRVARAKVKGDDTDSQTWSVKSSLATYTVVLGSPTAPFISPQLTTDG